MAIACLITAPITAFRAPRAREYLETLLAPPPATVYGLLLSVVGEDNRLVHRGAEIAVAVMRPGQRTRVLRTAWRVKDAKVEPGLDENKRPDFQELLIDVHLAVHVRDGATEPAPSLATRLAQALAAPATVRRFGGLALGESTFLVDELRALRPSDVPAGAVPSWLVRDTTGPQALPVWPDHVGSRGTRYGQFSLQPAQDVFAPPEAAWTPIVSGEA
ncbi:MAG: type I-MYXAN CRISPR-associated protein Cas5/Cmx5/DevS [Chloroflexi bacterium]|nr:type I-MYXAN CRISPR-associated protein Cas5/Cmx5/DevS [Chloroflexota bacterium]